MKLNVKTSVIGIATALVSPTTSLAYGQVSDSNIDKDSVLDSSNIYRTVALLDKSGIVTGVASNDYLNVRSSAVTNSSSIGKLSNGDTIIITGKDGEWYKIDYRGKVGYVYEKYVKVTGNITYKTTTDNLNMRASSNTSSNIITKIPKNTSIKIISSNNGWDKVYYNGQFGFCSNAYLKSSSTPSTDTTIGSTVSSLDKEGQVTGVASNDTLNVRSGTNTSATIVAKLKNGTKVKVLGQDSKTKWYKINYNGTVGYVNNVYIKIVDDKDASNDTSEKPSSTRKTTTNVNFRTGPSTSYSVIANVPGGTVVEYYSENNGWAKVKYNNKEGYINTAYLTTNTSSSTTCKKITTSNVNMRTGASTSHSIISTVASNTVVEVISSSDSWDKVVVGNKTGYINNAYLKAYNGSSDSNENQNSNLVSKPLYSKVKVVVDAGHGGTDPGAVANSKKEKDIVLSVSKKVNNKLKALGFQTIMTRTTDVYVTLSNRYSIANNNNADIFVSVHANSGAGSASGIETLYKNNKTLADNIQSGVINRTGGKSRGLKYRTDLAVLNGTKMPSALVEVGFISNQSESVKIANDSYQDKLAVGIVDGISKFTDNNIKK